MLGILIQNPLNIVLGAQMLAVRSFRSFLVLFVIGVGSASAQTGIEADGPAELPPSGFEGSQYIDSKGCLFIRAGLNGDVTWVPRVGANREMLCGFKPSIVESETQQPTPIIQPAAISVAAKAPNPVKKAKPVVDRSNRSLPSTTRKLPKGLKAAWTDGRLNPLRGPRSEIGNAQMARLWTDTVPAKLIKK